MEPTFADGVLVFIEPVGVRRFRPGDVIIARHPFKNLDLIKFIDQVDNDGYLTLRSPSGDDSRQFGRVLATTVKGRVTANLSTRQVAPFSDDTPEFPGN